MTSVMRLIKRFVITLILSLMVLLVLNIVLIIAALQTGDVIWHSENLPEEIQLHYSAAEISWYTRGYIADYPTTTAAMGENLIIVGNPKERYWKELYPTWNLNLIKNLPRTILIFFGANLVIVFLIYMIVVSGICVL